VLLLCQGGARFECVEDDADEQSFQAAECLAAALALAAFAFEVIACRRVVAGLGDRDPVDGGVELTVAAAVGPVPLGAARARLERCDAAVAGELRVAAEAVDRSDLGEQLGSGDGGAARQIEERRCDLRGSLLELLVEFGVDAVELTDRRDELAGEPLLGRLELCREHLVDRAPARRMRLVEQPGSLNVRELAPARARAVQSVSAR
jgi:hypothetical protein